MCTLIYHSYTSFQLKLLNYVRRDRTDTGKTVQGSNYYVLPPNFQTAVRTSLNVACNSDASLMELLGNLPVKVRRFLHNFRRIKQNPGLK